MLSELKAVKQALYILIGVACFFAIGVLYRVSMQGQGRTDAEEKRGKRDEPFRLSLCSRQRRTSVFVCLASLDA
jgi:hypothetical protein